MSLSLSSSRIFVAGHRGMVGSAIVRALRRSGCKEIIAAPREELDLTSHDAVASFFDATRPEVVFLAAAKVGGILANQSRPAEFIFENLQIQNHVINAAFRSGSRKLIFLGSSCIYPKYAEQPIRESALLTGPLEPTNEWYAVAKIAGIKLCQAFRAQYGFDAICLMPTNLYGPNDNFELQSSHVLPALLRKFHEATVAGAEEVVVWGTGTPRREFLHVDDLAEATLLLAETYSDSGIVNVGTGVDVSIAELAEVISEVVGFRGRISYDTTKPDGTPRKLLNIGKIRDLGWSPTIELQEGIKQTYDWYLRYQPAGH